MPVLPLEEKIGVTQKRCLSSAQHTPAEQTGPDLSDEQVSDPTGHLQLFLKSEYNRLRRNKLW